MLMIGCDDGDNNDNEDDYQPLSQRQHGPV